MFVGFELVQMIGFDEINHSEHLDQFKSPLHSLQYDFKSPLCKFYYKHLGLLSIDTESFDTRAGLPKEVVQLMLSLRNLAHSHPELFFRSPLLNDLIEFLRKIPEGLLPAYFVATINPSSSDQTIRSQLKKLPIENYLAFKNVAFFIHDISFSNNHQRSVLPFEEIERFTGICNVLTSNHSGFKPVLMNIFNHPLTFYPRKTQTQARTHNYTNNLNR